MRYRFSGVGRWMIGNLKKKNGVIYLYTYSVSVSSKLAKKGKYTNIESITES